MNRYRALTPSAVAAFGDGVVELDLSPTEEQDWLTVGALELVPRCYRALSANYRVPQGETFEDVFLVEIEAALVAGGHIERVDKPAPVKSKPPSKPETEE